MNKDLCTTPGCKNIGKYNRYCNHALLNMPEVKTINKVSDSRKEEEKKYKKVRKQYLKDHPECEAILPGCRKKSSEIHHKRGKVGELLYDVRYFLAVCRHCHEIIEHSPKYSKAHGLSESRLTKPNKRA